MSPAVGRVRAQPFDLLLLDMIMPRGIGGRETYQRIVAANPGQKAVLASGYAETAEVKRALEPGAGAFLSKPHSMHELASVVRAELDR